MSQKTVILCPGQGAQHVGMGRGWYEVSQAARRVYQQADAQLGMDLSRLCFEGPAEQLNRTDVAQVAIYVTSVACWAGLVEQGRVDPSSLGAVAGLSLGEYTALYLAGVFGFEDGLSLVSQRGRFMQEAAERAGGSMVALSGPVDQAKVQALCEAGSAEGLLVPANFNSPMQVVLSGAVEACRRVEALAESHGLRATVLAVAGAFHSPMMQEAADRMACALEAVAFGRPAVPVLSNVTGQPHEPDEPALLKQRLVEQITSPVRWEQDVRWLVQHVPGRYVELAPGKVLSGLMRRIDRTVKVINQSEPG